VVLDPRIITKRYGRMFLDALPDGIVAQVVG
jgi:Rad3-related DNA helicase